MGKNTMMISSRSFIIKRKYTAYFILLLIFLVVTSGCQYKNVTGNNYAATQRIYPETEKTENEAIIGGDLRVPIPQVVTLNPLLADTKGLSDFLGIMFEGLFEFGKDHNTYPVIASAWEVMENGLVWRIEIHEDVFFHNGVKLTAEDVEFTFKAIQSGIFSTRYAHGIVGNPDIETMVADENDSYTLFVHLFEPISNMRELLTFPILPKHLYHDATYMLERKSDMNFYPVGTGPFKFGSVGYNDSYIRLMRNTDWWLGQANLDSITGYVYQNEMAAINAFNRGELDLIDSMEIFVDDNIFRSDVRKYSYLTNYFEFIAINFDNAWLADLDLRKAVAYSIDRRRLISVVYNENAQISDSPIPPSSWLYKSKHGFFETDVDVSVKMLENAGWTHIDDNGVRYRETLAGREYLRLRLLTNLESSLRRHAMQIIAEQLKSIGVHVDIQIVPWDELTEALNKRNFDMVLTGFKTSRFPDISFTVDIDDVSSEIMLIDSMEYLMITEDSSKAYEHDELRAIFGEAQDYIHENLPFLSLYFRTASLLLCNNVGGMEPPFTVDVYKGIENWFVAR